MPDQDIRAFNLDMTTGGAKINGEWYDENTFLETFQIGDVIELTIKGTRVHPVHMHINPMQIVSIQSDTNYFQTGDWHGQTHFHQLVSWYFAKM